MSSSISLHPAKSSDAISVDIVKWGDKYLSVNIKFGAHKITIYPKDEDSIEEQLNAVLNAFSNVNVQSETL
jgi:hypothetical protein